MDAHADGGAGGGSAAAEELEELRPQDAAALSSKQLADELERRGLKVSGFADDDIKTLQKAYNAEFERDRAERQKQRMELMAKRRAEEERMRLQRCVGRVQA